MQPAPGQTAGRTWGCRVAGNGSARIAYYAESESLRGGRVVECYGAAHAGYASLRRRLGARQASWPPPHADAAAAGVGAADTMVPAGAGSLRARRRCAHTAATTAMEPPGSANMAAYNANLRQRDPARAFANARRARCR